MISTNDISSISNIAESLTTEVTANVFNPSDVDISASFPPSEKEQDLTEVYLSPSANTINSKQIIPKYPENYDIIAIDSTSFRLGIIDDGTIGSVRISVVKRNKETKKHYLDSYGPYNFAITSQNRQEIFDKLYEQVYALKPDSSKRKAPVTFKMLERIRAILERQSQIELIKKSQNSIILFDGSLIGDTQDTPQFFISNMLNEAFQNGNIVIGFSKETNLTLKDSGKNVLSILDNEIEPCYKGPLNQFIEQNPERYNGNIYVIKLKSYGENFRVDIPKNSPISVDNIFSYLAGIAGDFGYPEELKLAHTTCVLSSIEILECQAAASHEYKMHIEPNMHQRLFVPFR